MTRINTIDPVLLTTPWLLAEYRELPRIINRIASGTPTAGPFPKAYCMGKGHVSFFFNKLHWLYVRHNKLVEEMKRRGFNPNMEMHAAMDKCLKLRPDLCGNWAPAAADHEANLARLQERWPGTELAWLEWLSAVVDRHKIPLYCMAKLAFGRRDWSK